MKVFFGVDCHEGLMAKLCFGFRFSLTIFDGSGNHFSKSVCSWVRGGEEGVVTQATDLVHSAFWQDLGKVGMALGASGYTPVTRSGYPAHTVFGGFVEVTL